MCISLFISGPHKSLQRTHKRGRKCYTFYYLSCKMTNVTLSILSPNPVIWIQLVIYCSVARSPCIIFFSEWKKLSDVKVWIFKFCAANKQCCMWWHVNFNMPHEYGYFYVLYFIFNVKVNSVHWSQTRQEHYFLSGSWDKSVKLVYL